MGRLLQHLRFGARVLGRDPATAFLAVLMLALSVGANTALFSVVNAVSLKPLPYAQPDRLVHLSERQKESQLPLSSPNFVDWRDRNRV
jgi:putative ABC transport system permease protein